MLTKDDLLLYLCKATAQVPVGGYESNIYSIPSLARRMGETQYSVRKCMKALEADGLVHKTYEGGIDEDGYPHCYHGWSLIQRAMETEMYKHCEKEALDNEYRKFLYELDKEGE